jgi:2-dehydropantoate 2-reductase
LNILIYGAGGVGSVLGAFLARTGHQVSLLGRPWHLEAIRRNGLTVTGIWGDYRMKAFDLYASAAEIRDAGAKFDLIVLTVKSYDTAAAVADIAPMMTPETTLLSFQNGLGNVEKILEKIKPEQYLAGRVIFGVEIEPGLVRVTVSGDSLSIGALPGPKPLVSPERVAAVFTNSKVPAKAVPDILAVLWQKAIYNCCLNGICAVNEIPYGKILENDATRTQMEAVVHECYAVAGKKGVELDPSSADAFLDLLKTTLIPKTAAHYPSLLQDMKKGKRIDIDALNGAIVRLGEETVVSTPANRSVYEAVLNKYKKA